MLKYGTARAIAGGGGAYKTHPRSLGVEHKQKRTGLLRIVGVVVVEDIRQLLFLLKGVNITD